MRLKKKINKFGLFEEGFFQAVDIKGQLLFAKFN